ncbi:indolepyruvate ferredoxin oxidoreductase subunit alpha [Heliophilum fasciatum]|uniref:Indolepyruvate oxidoreductase subunit IorA n=1 Tax=Heliophilum fasciatum TaxID=35700 RepID=A0A4R2RV02_9FIRM|nr:indolepyruvate ferredoxin oxidoreductase subunit alpha [Heliophilum fasciatum]MCW2278367.1 indolepyruvate ferredoxin oxidoreductase alpha subunit [Heliophilum fasciatum]TCP63761.1 indolepyruvate ferredoxin oxidoreductase alpha subunit [Heliophilum fasciatum]
MQSSNLTKARRLLMGNEAIAWGAIAAGVRVVASYPGTPSTEVTETILRHAKDYQIYAEWSVNEKVALETAIAASWSGARAMTCMKQVGLNVASDPLMTLAYLGVKGGLVLVVADDPGPHSSQTEQDTRLFARFAKLPVFDPATPAEALALTQAAFELSETLQVPVILRPTTRVCHVCQDVAFTPPARPTEPRPATYFEKDPKWVILPALSAKKHRWLNAQQEAMRQWVNERQFNRLITAEPGQGAATPLEGNHDAPLAIITGGVSLNYIRETLALLGLSLPVYHVSAPVPLDVAPILAYLQGKQALLVVEEQEPVIEEQIIVALQRAGNPLPVYGKHSGDLPREGEFSLDLLLPRLQQRLQAAGLLASPDQAGIAVESVTSAALPPLPLRTPILCAGCGHRSVFYAFSRATRSKKSVFTGDIGCYTLGAMPPLNATDTCLCMGAAPAMAAGFSHVEPDRPHVAFLGDSTFFHSGIPPLINAVYNRAKMTLVILDNRTTAMTGHQPHPGLGITAMAEPTFLPDIEQIVRACGVQWVRTVDAYDLAATMAAAKEAIAHDGVSVVIARRECVAIVRRLGTYRIDQEACRLCGICLKKYGCPAIVADDSAEATDTNPPVRIVPEKCFGCGTCAQACPFGAIVREEI